jgi:gliding motility-associated-like protein
LFFQYRMNKLFRFLPILCLGFLFMLQANDLKAAKPTFKFSNISGCKGDTVCVDVTVEHFDSIVNFNFTTTWDASVVEFVGVNPNGIKNVNLPSWPLNQFNPTSPNSLIMTWFTNAADGYSVPNGTRIFSLCFVLKGNIGQNSTISIYEGVNTPILAPIEVIDSKSAASGGLDIGLNQVKGTISIVACNAVPLNLAFDNQFVAKGKQVCIAVTAKNFKNIKSMNYDIQWDNTIVKFDSIGYINPLLAGGLVPSPVPPNAISIAYTNFNASGLTLADNTILFYICFTAIGNPGQVSAVKIAPTPAPVVTNNSPTPNIGVSQSSGTVTISTPNTTPVVGHIDDITVTAGETFCVDVVVDTFQNIASFQNTISWDPTKLAFKEIKDITLPGPNIDYSTTTPGALAFTWYLASGSQTLAANASVYKVCFTVLSLSGTIPINMTNIPTTTEAYNVGGAKVDVKFKPSVVTIATVVSIADTTIIRPTCLNPAGGEIKLTPTGGKIPYTYQWSYNNLKTQDIKNLPGGNYTVTITDSSTPPNKYVADFVITGDFIPPTAKVVATDLVTCPDQNVDLLGTGSSTGGTINYAWTTKNGVIGSGASNINAVANAAGTYTLKVINIKNGCFDTAQVVVKQAPDVPIANAGIAGEVTCNAGAINLDANASSKGANFKYLWTTANGNIVSGETTLTPKVNKAGTYLLKVTNTVTGCSALSTVIVKGSATIPYVSIEPVKDTITCKNNSLVLDATNSSLGADYSTIWTTIGGKIISNATGLTPTIEKGGIYILTITHIATGCKTVDSLLVHELGIPQVKLSALTATINCKNPTAVLDATGTTTSSTFKYTWEAAGPKASIVSGGNTLTCTVGGEGKYTLTVIDTIAKCSAVGKVDVSIDTLKPEVKLTATSKGQLDCTTTELLIDGSTGTSVGSRYQYTWTGSDPTGIVSGANTLILKVNQPGVYSLMLQDTINGCTAEKEITITNDSAKPTALISNTQSELTCSVKEINLNSQGSTIGVGVTYQWYALNTGHIKGSDLSKPLIQVDKPGTFVLVILNTLNGCSDTTSIDITQQKLTNANAGLNDFECQNSSLLTANLPLNTTGKWTSVNPNASIQEPNSLSTEVSNLNVGKNFFIWTLSTDDCPSYSSDTVQVTVEGTPQLKADDFKSPQVADPLTIDLTKNDKLNGLKSYSCVITSLPKYGTIDSTTIKGTFIYTAVPGFAGSVVSSYKLCSNLCPALCDTAKIKITIDQGQDTQIKLPNVITPNGDGKNDFLYFDVIEFNPEKYSKAEFLVYNRWGEIVYQAKPYKNDWAGTNNAGQPLPQGTYYFILRLSVQGGAVLDGDVTILK